MRLTEPISLCNQATAFSENADTRGEGGAIRPDSTSEAVTRPVDAPQLKAARSSPKDESSRQAQTHPLGMHPQRMREAANRDKKRPKVAGERITLRRTSKG